MSKLDERILAFARGIPIIFLVFGAAYGILGTILFFQCFSRIGCAEGSNIFFSFFIPSGLVNLLISSIFGESMFLNIILSTILCGTAGFIKGLILKKIISILRK